MFKKIKQKDKLLILPVLVIMLFAGTWIFSTMLVRKNMLTHTQKVISLIEDEIHKDYLNGKSKELLFNGNTIFQKKYKLVFILGLCSLVIIIGLGYILYISIQKEDAKIRSSEAKYRTIAEYTHDWEYWMDTKGNYLFISPSVLHITGYNVDDFMKDQSLFEKIIYPEDRAQVKKHINKTLTNYQHSYHIDFRIWTKEGKLRWISQYARPIYDENQQWIGVRGSNRDFTKRKEAESRYKSFFKNSFSIMLIIDPLIRKIVDANKAACNFYGYEYNKFVSLKVDQIMSKKHEYSLSEQDILEKNYINSQHVLSNKEKVDVEIYSGKISIGANNLVYWIVHDITERVRAEQALMESEEKFRTIFNTSTNAIFINDLKGKFIEVNDTACKMLEYTKEELMQLEPTDISTTIKKTQYDGRVDELIQTDQLLFGTTFLTKSGKTIPIEATSSIVRYQNKKTILTIVNDITEREQMHNRLLRTILKTEEKERKRFATDLHDGMGSLLSSIGIYLDLLKQEDLSYDERINLADYTIGLVNEAIASSKEIANNLRPSTITKFGLLPSLRAFCEKINQTGILHVNLDSDKFVIQLDNNTEVILFRIIGELINNTIQHSAAKNIQIKLSNTSKTLYLDYFDDGTGFDVEKVMNDVTRGSGLTNIISRIRSISGECSIRSEIGKGTTIAIEAELNKG